MMSDDATICFSGDRKRSWLSPWGEAVNREATVCFRTDQVLCRNIEALARKKKMSLSSAIEMMLKDYLEKHEQQAVGSERRRYPRKQVSVPAFVETSGLQSCVKGGLLVDVSLGGMCVSLSDDYLAAVGEGGAATEFETSFILPDATDPVRMLCKSEWVMPAGGAFHVGASFQDGAFADYQHLQRYLMQ
jgi:hypothetical protein